jgi:hypothetical protein
MVGHPSRQAPHHCSTMPPKYRQALQSQGRQFAYLKTNEIKGLDEKMPHSQT